MHYFEDPFWSQLVDQMCEGHPVVRHAVMAMDSRHRQFEEFQTKQIEDRESLLALTHSSKAIACVRGNFAREARNRHYFDDASSLPRRHACRPLWFSIWA